MINRLVSPTTMYFEFQEAWNELSKLSCKACSHLSGHHENEQDSTQNQLVQSILSTLLTKYIIQLMKNDEPKNVSNNN